MINNINVVITTKCNRSCPDCFANCPTIKGKNVNWKYLENLAKYIKGIDTVTITGGEPTVHPQFTEFAPKLRELFGCKTLDLETNGYAFKLFPVDVFKHFDNIHVSDYGDNLTTIEGKETIVYPLEGVHINKNTRKEGGCFRGIYYKISFANGKFYRCCSGYGVPNQIGLEPCENWMTEIEKQVLNCGECLFSGSDE